MMKHVEAAKTPPPKDDVISNLVIPKSPYRATWFNQFYAVQKRSILELARDPSASIVKLCQIGVSSRQLFYDSNHKIIYILFRSSFLL